MAALSRTLLDLCAELGVATDYWDWRGRQVEVSRATLEAVLAALGVDASTDGAAAGALAGRRAASGHVLPACLTVREGVAHWLGDAIGPAAEVAIELEDGGVRAVSPVAGRGYAVPADLPVGSHQLTVRDGKDVAAHLIVTPARVELPAGLDGRRVWGFTTQLYATRSRRSWAIGDLADLSELAGWSGRMLGAGFVLVNPLHAAEPLAPIEASPYLPTTRRFVNPIYIRVEAIPECAYLPPAHRARVEAIAAEARKRSATDELIDRDAVWAAKVAALELVFAVPRGPGREAAFEAFVHREGAGLTDFATWCALAEEHGPLWRQWPQALHDPRSDAVAQAARGCAGRVDFYRWLQWIADEQLAAVHAVALAAGMPLGVVHDLAVGVHADGADAWSLQDVLAPGITVGAPPDEFNPHGQTWSQPPWHPMRLAAAGYRPYRDLLRGVFRHAGGVRVDHVMGLFRLWWVPEGEPPSAGTYVRYDHEALVGVLALEARRAGALVIGEDLGTVEPAVREHLGDRGILGTSVLWFERDWSGDGGPLAPQRWRRLCLATVTTHDLPPSAAHLAGEHLALRDQLGLLDRPYADAAAEHRRSVDDWLELLRELSILRPGASEREIVVALHRLLTWTPALLVGVSLADAVGDRRCVNLPGTTKEYPNWRLPLADPAGRPVLLEEMAASRAVHDLVQALVF